LDFELHKNKSKYISPGRAMMLQKQMFVPMTLPMFKEFCNPSNTNKKKLSSTCYHVEMKTFSGKPQKFNGRSER
jgi:hypothetical protein